MFDKIRVPAELLASAHIERVSDFDARTRFGIRCNGNAAGLMFPYCNPVSDQRWTARLRRDNPEIENGKPRKKYLCPYGDSRHLYFVPGCAEYLADPSVPIIFVEAEKSALSLTAWSQRTGEKLLPIAMGGCWGWRGKIGKIESSNGERIDETGPLRDLNCARDGRRAYILLDSNSNSNQKVQNAREELARQLRKQRADVRILNLPGGEGVNGPDDFIGVRGDDAMRELLAGAELGFAILSDIEAFLRRFVIMSDSQYVATTLWIAHTYCYKCFIWTPYLHITSAEKRCAKSRTLETVGYLVRKPWHTSSVSGAVLVRRIDSEQPTLLFDEVDAQFKADKETAQAVRQVLNAGAHCKGVASRCTGKGVEIESRDFHVFCPKALAGIGNLPETVADRCLPIELRRKLPTETVERLREKTVAPDVAGLKKRLADWIERKRPNLVLYANCKVAPELPEELNDRQRDGAEPLLAIADAAGGSWPERARSALVELYTGAAAEDRSLRTLLLRDIRSIFDESPRDRLPSADILERLNKIEESPWSEWRGKPLTAHGLSKLLKPFDITPKNIRFDDAPQAKGYDRESFTDAWDRYLPLPPPP
jgi:hypothetical protein